VFNGWLHSTVNRLSSKNDKLVDALRIKGTPTFIIYKNSEMKWRQSGEQDANTLINLVEQFM